jgi:hypothetical protein
VNLEEKRREIKRLTLEAIGNKKTFSSEYFKATFETMKPESLFEETVLMRANGWKVTELFNPRQGVTWGGEGCKSIFVVDESVASELEPELIHRTIGGKDVLPKRIVWMGDYLVFPYVGRSQRWIAAFQNPNRGGVDSLDFNENVDSSEKGQKMEWKLKNRTGRNYVPFPKTAEYLFNYYKILSERIFKGKPLSGFRKMWYEYIWQRDPSIAVKNKIVTPRLTQKAQFAVDKYGYLPRDSIISLLPRGRFSELKDAISKVVKKSTSDEMALNYVCAFLNSTFFDDLLQRKRAKKRGGYPMIGEKMLGRFIIPKPQPSQSHQVKSILNSRYDQKDIEVFYQSVGA